MGVVVSLEGFLPVARFDAVPWEQARIEEGSTSAGAWGSIDTVALSPVDPDPTHPAARSFTTGNGTGPGLWYRVVFVDGNADESAPTDPVRNAAASNVYATREELKSTLSLGGQNFADEQIDIALEAASRAIDNAVGSGRRFYTSVDPETRYFPVNGWTTTLDVGEVTDVSEVLVDTGGDLTYATSWTPDVDYLLEPFSALADGLPYTRIIPGPGRVFPAGVRAVKVTGRFGFPEPPAAIKAFTMILAGKLLKRMREQNALMGVVTAGIEEGVAVRLARLDPDFETYVGPYVRGGVLID